MSEIRAIVPLGRNLGEWFQRSNLTFYFDVGLPMQEEIIIMSLEPI